MQQVTIVGCARFIVSEFRPLCFFHVQKDMVPFYNDVLQILLLV